MKITIKEVAHHRNGLAGVPFHIVTFDLHDNGPVNHMAAVVFGKQNTIAVMDVDMLAAGNIAFAGGNSWRGDIFENDLREAVRKYEENRA